MIYVDDIWFVKLRNNPSTMCVTALMEVVITDVTNYTVEFKPNNGDPNAYKNRYKKDDVEFVERRV